MIIYCEGIYREVADNEFSKWEKIGYKKVEVKPVKKEVKEEKPKKATAKKSK